MTGFWIAATAMAALALSFVVPRLWRGTRASDSNPAAGEVRRKLASLKQALADGHLSRTEYDRRREQLGGALAEALEGGPVATRAPVTAWSLLILTPLAAVALYLQVGNPRAIVAGDRPATPAPAAAAPGAEAQAQAPELTAAITQLAARLAQNPDDVNGWFLLGRSYMAVDRYADARDAFKRALELAPGEPALMVEYAEAIAFAGGQGRLPEQAEALLRAALELEPESQKGLWMLGMAAFQRRDYDAALEHWQRLARLLEPDSPVARQLGEQIAEARAARGDTGEPPPAIAADQPAPEPPPALAVEQAAPEPPPAAALEQAEGEAPALTIEVSLAEELRARVAPGDTLFVFARAVSGPRVPLAIQRLAAAELPARVRLDATMGMMPSMTLATFPEVIVGARISKTGNAAPQPGDLEALSEPVSNRSREPVRLHIDKVL